MAPFILFDRVTEENGRPTYLRRVRRPLYTPNRKRAHRFPSRAAAERVQQTEGGFIEEVA